VSNLHANRHAADENNNSLISHIDFFMMPAVDGCRGKIMCQIFFHLVKDSDDDA